MKINTKSSMNFIRKFWHMVPGITIVFVILFNVYTIDFIRDLLLKMTIGSILIDYLRLRNRKFNKLVITVFKLIIRREEYFAPSGISAYVGSSALVLFFFPLKVALLSILFLAIADPMASFCGIFFKNNKYNYKFVNGKSLFGLIGAGVSCVVIMFGMNVFFIDSIQHVLVVGVICGLVVGLVETFQPEDLNDNLLIPVCSAFCMQSLYVLLN